MKPNLFMCSFQSKGNYPAQNILWLSRCIENQHGYIQLLVSPSGVETHTAININVCAFLDLSSSVPSNFLQMRKNIKEHILIGKAKQSSGNY